MDLRVRVVDAAATRELRRTVLRPTWPPESAMHGDENADAVHVAAYDDDALVGACLILPRPYPVRPEQERAWQLRGMATTPERQGHGIGGLVLTAALAEVLRRRGRLIWCDARTSAVRFYAQHGFTAEGPEFIHTESGIPHYRMWRRLDLRGTPGPIRGRFPTR
jgi:predicted GNAT family N-acyltransferase